MHRGGGSAGGWGGGGAALAKPHGLQEGRSTSGRAHGCGTLTPTGLPAWARREEAGAGSIASICFAKAPPKRGTAVAPAPGRYTSDEKPLCTHLGAVSTHTQV